MSKSEIALWCVVGVLALRSIMQQIYIARLKGAMINICEAMERSTGLKLSDRVRGGFKLTKKGLEP